MGKQQKGFAILDTLLILAIVGIVGGVGWYVWHFSQTQQVKNYDECLAEKGSKILESYPPICVTKKGKKFTDTKASPYVEVKEWQVRLVINTPAKGVHYRPANADLIVLSSEDLDTFAKAHNECSGATEQIMIARTKDAKAAPTNNIKVGAYYYYFQANSGQSPCVGTDIGAIQKLNDQAYELQAQLPTYKDIKVGG